MILAIDNDDDGDSDGDYDDIEFSCDVKRYADHFHRWMPITYLPKNYSVFW